MEDVERPATHEIDDHGDIPAAASAAGTVHDLLVDADRHARAGLAGVELLVGEQARRGVLDRAHHRLPADPELAGHLGDGTAELTDLAGRLVTGPLGQHRPRGDARMAFAPRTTAVAAAPLALVPDQPGRLRPDGKVTDLGNVPATRHRPLPALAADVVVADGLDEHVPLIDELEHLKDAQPGDPEQRHRRRR